MGLSSLIDDYDEAWKVKMGDPRTQNWFMMTSPIPTILIVMGYLAFVHKGLRWMKKREAYDLKRAIQVYNFCLILLNAYIFYEFFISAWMNPKVDKFCAPIDSSDDPMSLRLANAVWWFYFSKIIELMDTIFFILRKKNTQVTFLHVYHHSTMPSIWWIGVFFAPGGEAYLCTSINSFIHILMYSYYFLSSLGPHMQKYLWWKKYMTTLQLVQFWWIMFHTINAIHQNCGFPNKFNWSLIVYDLSHIILFTNFYYETYTKKERRLKLEKEMIAKTEEIKGNKVN